EYTYCYISPIHYGSRDFDSDKTTYRKFLKKSGFYKRILKDVFITRSRKYQADVNFGNYDVNM
ncbi:MAG TPA: hypothetical protein PKN32_12685, partial [Bacteroidales bacterium]|nr:hypothetical protein [Bacteroidales bacterium]